MKLVFNNIIKNGQKLVIKCDNQVTAVICVHCKPVWRSMLAKAVLGARRATLRLRLWTLKYKQMRFDDSFLGQPNNSICSKLWCIDCGVGQWNEWMEYNWPASIWLCEVVNSRFHSIYMHIYGWVPNEYVKLAIKQFNGTPSYRNWDSKPSILDPITCQIYPCVTMNN